MRDEDRLNLEPPPVTSGAVDVRISLIGAAVSLLIIATLTLLASVLRLNPASAGLLLLVGILLIASRYPLIVATSSSIVATLSYNFFFFPPTGTFTIEDPENWIALATFLTTSLLANRLLVRERRQASLAHGSRMEIEALYAMGVDLLRATGGIEQAGEAAARYVRRIGVAGGGVILFGASAQHQRVLAWSGAPPTDEMEDLAAGVGRHGRATDIPSRFGRDLCLPLVVAGRVKGAFIVRGVASLRALESAAALLSFAIERERFFEERAHLAALQESDELKGSLLQAVSHDLKSPLTVLTVESEALERKLPEDAEGSGHVRIIRAEVARLHRRIDNLLSVARFEAGVVTPRADPTPAADLFRAARESLPTITSIRRIRTSVDPETGDLMVDPSLALEIVVNLIENAHHASQDGEPLELWAFPSPEQPGRVWIEVRDRGVGLPGDQLRSLRTMRPVDAANPGLGIELARRLASLSGGSVEWFSRPGGGTIARLDLPASAPALPEVPQ